MQDIQKTIFARESELQQPETRKSIESLDDLISDNFIEFGSSGQIYTKNDVLKNLPASPEIKFVMTNFRINVLSTEIVQSLFQTEKTNLITGEITKSLRSSLWRNENSQWKMIFHQGTPLAN